MFSNESKRLLRIREVRRLTGLSKTSLYRLEAKHDFPQRVKLTTRSTAWVAHEVAAWIDTRPRGIRSINSAQG
jgi:prophage regulatory protein